MPSFDESGGMMDEWDSDHPPQRLATDTLPLRHAGTPEGGERLWKDEMPFHRATLALTRAIHPAALYQAVVEGARGLLHASTASLYLAGIEPDALRLVASDPRPLESSSPEVPLTLPLSPDASAPTSRLLGALLWADERLLGVLCVVAGASQPFSLTDQQRLEHFALHAAAALERQQQVEQTAQRREELELLYRIALKTSSVLDREVLLERLYHELTPWLAAHTFIVLLHDAERAEVEVAFIAQEGTPVAHTVGARVPLAEAGLAGWVIEQRQPLHVRDTLGEPLPRERGALVSEVVRSWLGAPLLRASDGLPIGAIVVHSPTPDAFSETAQRFLEALTTQVAPALVRAHRFRQERQQAAELEAVWHATLSLSSSLESKTVLDAILQAVLRLLDGVQDAHIFLYREDRLTFGAALWADGRNLHLHPRSDGLTYRVARQGTMIAISDMNSHPLFAAAPADWPRGAIVGLPLSVGERVVGVMNVAFSRPHILSERELRLLQRLADQAALAIENARLFEAAEQRAAELEAVRQATLSLTSSLEPQDVLDAILHATLRLLGEAWGAHVFLYDAGALTFGAALHEGRRVDHAWNEPRPYSLTYTVARRGETIVVPDVASHPLFTNARPTGLGAIVSLPLKLGDRVVGVMNLTYRESHDFTDTELRLLRLLGDQAAIAIERARLHGLVSQEARTDALTGLPNRRALDERLADEVLRATRYEHHFSLLMMDLDGFKLINDTHGHPTGDAVLQQVARNMLRAIRDTDFLARYGGDEFALLMPETDETSALLVANKLWLAATTGFDLPLPELYNGRFSLSVGLATFPTQASDGLSLLSAADRALYEAKRKRRLRDEQ